MITLRLLSYYPTDNKNRWFWLSNLWWTGPLNLNKRLIELTVIHLSFLLLQLVYTVIQTVDVWSRLLATFCNPFHRFRFAWSLITVLPFNCITGNRINRLLLLSDYIPVLLDTNSTQLLDVVNHVYVGRKWSF